MPEVVFVLLIYVSNIRECICTLKIRLVCICSKCKVFLYMFSRLNKCVYTLSDLCVYALNAKLVFKYSVHQTCQYVAHTSNLCMCSKCQMPVYGS